MSAKRRVFNFKYKENSEEESEEDNNSPNDSSNNIFSSKKTPSSRIYNQTLDIKIILKSIYKLRIFGTTYFKIGIHFNLILQK